MDQRIGYNDLSADGELVYMSTPGFFTIFGMMIPMTTYRKGVETADQEFFWDFLFNFRCSPWLGDNTRACHFSGPLKAGSMCSSLRWCQSITCVLRPPSLNEKVMDQDD